MKRVLVSVALILALPLTSNPKGTFDAPGFFHLYMEMDKFARRYQGCPEKGYPPAIVCQPGVGFLDSRLWRSLEKEGKDFFKE